MNVAGLRILSFQTFRKAITPVMFNLATGGIVPILHPTD